MNRGRLLRPRIVLVKVYESDDQDSQTILCRLTNDACILLEERKARNGGQGELKVLTSFGCGWVATNDMELL